MITESKTLDQLLTDQEGAQILSTYSFALNAAEGGRRTTRPLAAMKERRFRHRFDRHRHISR